MGRKADQEDIYKYLVYFRLNIFSILTRIITISVSYKCKSQDRLYYRAHLNTRNTYVIRKVQEKVQKNRIQSTFSAWYFRLNCTLLLYNDYFGA